MKALNNLFLPTAPFRLGSDRMLDDRSSPKAKSGRGQELKRTYNTSFGAAGENQVSDTDDSGKEDKGNSPGETLEKVSTGCKTLTHKTLYYRRRASPSSPRKGPKRLGTRPRESTRWHSTSCCRTTITR